MTTTSRAEAAHPTNEHTGGKGLLPLATAEIPTSLESVAEGLQAKDGGRKLLAVVPAKLAKKSPVGVSERLTGEFPLGVGKTCWEVTCRATGESHRREGIDGPR